MSRRKGHQAIDPARRSAAKTAVILVLTALATPGQATTDVEKEYLDKVRKERAEYAEYLKTTWVFDVIARPKIRQGSQTIGSAEGNDIVIGICPDRLGVVDVENGKIHLRLDAAADAVFQGSKQRSGEMKKGYGDTNRVECKDGFLYAHHLLDELRIVKPGAGPDPVPRFHDVGTQWRIKGQYVPLTNAVRRTYTNSRGIEDSGFVYGRLKFELDGKRYELEPNPVAQEYSDVGIVQLGFWDRTNGKTTYGGGRYVNVEIPAGKQKEQIVTIDFNDAYNPTCVFDANISCALPPPENRLRTAVTAGEMLPEKIVAPVSVGGPRRSQLHP